LIRAAERLQCDITCVGQCINATQIFEDQTDCLELCGCYNQPTNATVSAQPQAAQALFVEAASSSDSGSSYFQTFMYVMIFVLALACLNRAVISYKKRNTHNIEGLDEYLILKE
jgi:hypothetical protein